MTIRDIFSVAGKESGRPQIDLTGPDGNVFYLMGQARRLAKQLDKDPDQIIADMQSADYEHAIEVFDHEFGEYVDLYR